MLGTAATPGSRSNSNLGHWPFLSSGMPAEGHYTTACLHGLIQFAGHASCPLLFLQPTGSQPPVESFSFHPALHCWQLQPSSAKVSQLVPSTEHCKGGGRCSPRFEETSDNSSAAVLSVRQCRARQCTGSSHGMLQPRRTVHPEPPSVRVNRSVHVLHEQSS